MANKFRDGWIPIPLAKRIAVAPPLPDTITAPGDSMPSDSKIKGSAHALRW